MQCLLGNERDLDFLLLKVQSSPNTSTDPEVSISGVEIGALLVGVLVKNCSSTWSYVDLYNNCLSWALGTPGWLTAPMTNICGL